WRRTHHPAASLGSASLFCRRRPSLGHPSGPADSLDAAPRCSPGKAPLSCCRPSKAQGRLFTGPDASFKAHQSRSLSLNAGPVSSTLRILHCLHAPVGGLFRHVHDLAIGQPQLGAEVGVFCDSRIEGAPAALARLSDYCALGLMRIPISRRLGLGDLRTAAKVRRLAAKLGIDVIHGHGAKGGVHARLAARKLKRKGAKVKAIYTPHGGSLHSSPSRPSGRLHLTAERMLKSSTDGLVFESSFAANRYIALTAQPRCPGRIVPKGLTRPEFYEPMLSDDAVDYVLVGQLRRLKDNASLLH